MAKQVKLMAERRTAIGRSAVRKLKAAGSVPAVMYGSKDKPEALQVSRRDINSLLSHAAGENILVELEIAGKSRLALAFSGGGCGAPPVAPPDGGAPLTLDIITPLPPQIPLHRHGNSGGFAQNRTRSHSGIC